MRSATEWSFWCCASAKDVIPLSSSVAEPSVYPVCEHALGINLTDYALGNK